MTRAKRLCDWWMPSRAKCPMEGTERTADRFGAPLRFCKVHLPRAGEQYPMAVACDAPRKAAGRMVELTGGTRTAHNVCACGQPVEMTPATDTQPGVWQHVDLAGQARRPA
jgi:hypothetical protein